MGAPNLETPGSHLLELTLDACRVARSASFAAAEGIATASKDRYGEVRERERQLDSLDRDIDDLVTTTITKVGDDEAKTLLACMKFGISLERIGDLLLSFVNRAEAIAAHMDHDDLRDLSVMSSQLERMLNDIEAAFRTRSLDRAVSVLRSDAELDRLRNVITFRHLEPSEGQRRFDSFHVLFMAQEIERAGDHVKNMAEEICHLVSGRTVRHVLRSYDRPVEQLFLDHMKSRM
ncbi:MAG TPA: PhoU domain-containing protein [Candidatus Saccharimonadales bacterium]|nr:PhoU domain-containing protein [Candidatus Saccharimonadales bacterium]